MATNFPTPSPTHTLTPTQTITSSPTLVPSPVKFTSSPTTIAFPFSFTFSPTVTDITGPSVIGAVIGSLFGFVGIFLFFAFLCNVIVRQRRRRRFGGGAIITNGPNYGNNNFMPNNQILTAQPFMPNQNGQMQQPNRVIIGQVINMSVSQPTIMQQGQPIVVQPVIVQQQQQPSVINPHNIILGPASNTNNDETILDATVVDESMYNTNNNTNKMYPNVGQ
jgi:hypothetical protein